MLGQDGVRGAEFALNEAGYKAGGKKIEIIKGSSDASPDSAVKAARKLVEQDGVAILIGPLSGDEGLAVKDYAKTQPNVTFVNGTSAAQDTTLRDPAPNFFRFSTDGAQWMAGLGDYAYNEKKYKTVVDRRRRLFLPLHARCSASWPAFCRDGGHVPKKFWVPIGNKDFSSVIAAIPDNVDAIYVALGGADGVNFLTQYQQAGGTAPLIGGSITVDQTVLGTQGKQRDYVVGTPSAGPIADNSEEPAWKKFVADYKAAYKDGFPSPSLFAQGYYINTKAVLLALDKVGGDLSDKEAKFREALGQARVRHADRQGQARQEPPGDRRQLSDRSRQGRRRASLQQGHQGRARTSTRRSAFPKPTSSSSASPAATIRTASEPTTPGTRRPPWPATRPPNVFPPTAPMRWSWRASGVSSARWSRSPTSTLGSAPASDARCSAPTARARRRCSTP